MTTGPKPPSGAPGTTDVHLHTNRRSDRDIIDFEPDSDSVRVTPEPAPVVSAEEIGDTSLLVIGKESSSLVVDSGSSNEILDLLIDSLNKYPERIDLWTMRFEMQSALGMKEGFADAMRAAYANKVIRSKVDWLTIGKQWNALAPDEPPPDGVLLPRPRALPAVGATPERAWRRFSDIAPQIAGSELEKLAQHYQNLRSQPAFFREYARRTRQLLHRPTPLHHAEALSRSIGCTARIFLKREDLRHESPETETAVMQAYIAESLGKQHVITGNDVDEYSIALATIALAFNLKATIVVRQDDHGEKADLMAQLRSLGADVEVMSDNDEISNDPRETALRLWQEKSDVSHLALSYGAGPSPFPTIVNDFQMQLGFEADLQLRAKAEADRPRTLVAAVHSEADSIGFMLMYLARPEVPLYYAEPEQASGVCWKSSKRLRAYNGAQREHTWLRATERIFHTEVPDSQAGEVQLQLKNLEGISVGLEDARAVALASRLAREDNADRNIVVLVA